MVFKQRRLGFKNVRKALMDNLRILVFGKNGQLAKSLDGYLKFNPTFLSRDDVDLTSILDIKEQFLKYKPDFVINTSAFTNVELAETSKSEALTVNAENVKNIAQSCNEFAINMIHISSDYVFDGNSNESYTPECNTNPINHYGLSKLIGEQMAHNFHNQCMIIRTSWLFSENGNNFLKKMILNKHLDEFRVVNDQFGSPTYSNELARAISLVIESYRDKKLNNSIYHFSSGEVVTWYEFTKKIFNHFDEICNSKLSSKLIPCKSDFFSFNAERPKFSALDPNKFLKDFSFNIEALDDSIRTALLKIIEEDES